MKRLVLFLFCILFIFPCFPDTGFQMTTAAGIHHPLSFDAIASSTTVTRFKQLKPRKKKRKRSKKVGPKKHAKRKKHKSRSRSAVYKRKGTGII
jgi:hypothetical protein